MQINLTPQQLSVLDKAIQQMPYHVAAPLIAHINKEIQNNHDNAVDNRDMPSGATVIPDQFRGD